MAGQISWGADGKVNATGLEAQCRQALKQVHQAVEAAGGTADDIQILRLYIHNFQFGPDADLLAKVHAETFGSESRPFRRLFCQAASRSAAR